MTYEGTVKFIYNSKEVAPYGRVSSSLPELLPQETVTIESDCWDLNIHQYFEMFKKFVRAIGFSDKNILQGACHLAFNESNPEEMMRDVAEEYDLIMVEDFSKKYEERLKEDEEWKEKTNPEWEKRYWQLYNRFRKFARFTDAELDEMVKDTMPPWGHSDMEAMKYTDEELNAMCDAAEKKEPKTYDEMIAAGYEMTADGFWMPKENFKPWNGLVPGSEEAVEKGCMCPVMDNSEMPEDKKWVDAECPIHGRKK